MNKDQEIMPLPYEANIGDRLNDEGANCWVIDCEQGSVAEMQCPADVEGATAKFIAYAANNHEARERLLNTSLDLLVDVYNSRASQRISAIGLSRIQSHIADIRSVLAEKES